MNSNNINQEINPSEKIRLEAQELGIPLFVLNRKNKEIRKSDTKLEYEIRLKKEGISEEEMKQRKIELRKQKNRENVRKYRQNHPQILTEEKKERLRRNMKIYHENNKDIIKVKSKIYYEQHKEEIIKRVKQKYEERKKMIEDIKKKIIKILCRCGKEIEKLPKSVKVNRLHNYRCQNCEDLSREERENENNENTIY